MKSIPKMIIYPGAGLIVFALALCVILAMKGKLNSQALGGLALVGKQEKPDEKPAEPLQTVSTMRYFSSEEISNMLKEAQQRKAQYEARLADVAEREKRLVMMREELTRERKAIDGMRAELDGRLNEVKQAESTYSASVAEVKQTEQAGLERSALIYAAMDSKKAAAAILMLEKTQAAKLLSFMDEKKAARVLGEMQPQAAAELMSTLKQVKAENKND